MISYISVSERNSRQLRRALLISMPASVFCLLFSLIYSMFSHGVRSPFMTFAFAWPLFLCVIPYGLFLLLPAIPGPSLLSTLIWNTAVATLTVSSLLRGVFDIAGNSSQYQVIMMAFGFFLLFCGFIAYIAGILLLKDF